ncbi:TPA: hypothetical protein QDZ75_004578 [Stenotrophomonas maltophilia]|nr:hypothetical protein [Stenotrophomonas maltophilia]HDS1140477.1 hypothetical protein [Stenotrophomonas maltophilia]HEL5402363.1 hypothetical protein [Stenotrophomonas maltophilia]HEL5404380.1 hypothetical protein [Stenotrophomonas maltophilia]
MRNMAVHLLALALASPAAVAADGPSAQAVLNRIANEGGRKVLWDLWEHQRDFEQVTSGIESGDPSWLKVAAALKPYSDAGASLSINYAVARALPKAPERVLALTTHGFKVEDICTSPFIEPDPGVAEAYERRTLAALSRMKGAALAPVAAECAAQVRLPDGA